jgi:hypothetical protein
VLLSIRRYYDDIGWISTDHINVSINGTLVFSAIGKGLRTVDLKDENIVEIVAFADDCWYRVTSFNDRLYYTDSIRSEVGC